MKACNLNVIVIDNDKQLHESYFNYFEKYSDYNLNGIYATIEQALEDLDRTQPDIIISEISLQGLGGIDGIRHFRKRDADVKIIMISVNKDFEIVKRAFKNGANGYLTKPLTKKRLLYALNSIRYEGAALSSDIAKQIISVFQRKSYKFFSERENQIVDYLCQGATYKIIADKLFVTTSAINFHIQNIYLKLDVNSKSEALTKLQALE